jgi:hypothetical protein
MKTQGRTKRHHYVPNFYLKHFHDQEERIWLYDKRAKDIAGSIRPDKTENVAVQGNIYSVLQDDGTYDDRIDEWLQTVESAAAPVHNKLAAGVMVAGQEKADYAVFLSSLATRTPAILNTIAELHGAFMQSRTLRILEDESRFQAELQDFKRSPFCKNPEKVDAKFLASFLRDKNMYTLRIHQKAGLSAFRFTDKLTDKFFDMDWSLYESRNRPLITSDNPLVQTYIGETTTRAQCANPIELVTLPLSPSMMLELRWKRRRPSPVRQVSKDVAALYNSMRASNAEQFVFADRRDSGIAALVRKHRDDKMRADLTIAGPVAQFAAMEVARKL